MTHDHETVTVTGASGFVGSHCVLQLLEAGYRVRGTLRSLTKADHVREMLHAHLDFDDVRLSFAAADLGDDQGWPEAMEGATALLHVASPFPDRPPKHDDELIIPAREGALRALRAARAAGVRRAVMTSSIASIIYDGRPRDGAHTHDESCWSNIDDDIGAYAKSKTLAERAAWKLAEEPNGAMELATINPGVILGPALGAGGSTSLEIVRKLLARELPGCPDVSFAVVDVRDVAAAHLAAITASAAAGERFIVVAGELSMLEMAKILSESFGPRGYRPPTQRLPDFVVKLASLFDPSVKLVVPELGKRTKLASDRARDRLGWTPRPLRDTVIETAESLIDLGLV